MKKPFVTYRPEGIIVESLSWTEDDKAMIRTRDGRVFMVPISDLDPNPREAFYRREMERGAWVP